MGLFDIFSADPGQEAAAQAHAAQVGGINRGERQARQQFGNAQQTHRRAGQQARGAINRGFGTARGDIRTGRDRALGFIDRGTNQAAGEFDNALGLYDALAPSANRGYRAYADASGARGQEGFDRATENFRANPGYQFALEQGQEALMRNANARGMLSSGNTSQDLVRYSQGQADQEYDDYVNRLSPYLNLAPQIAGAQSSLYSQLANLHSNAGINQANIAQTAGTNLANMATGRGRDISNIATRTGGNVAGLYEQLGQLGYNTSVAQGQAGADLAQNQFAAEQGANQNLWNAITGVAGGAAQGAGYIRS